ncbi:hypothetical protein [Bordetella genomosp. 13]|uniref:hypothetical protein n=1 Tax=Bordetella genomosp. 13 TaxID=463040 RepID=UPI0011A52967|nr:hypothetical protein [Bordetella genomosp. 13]
MDPTQAATHSSRQTGKNFPECALHHYFEKSSSESAVSNKTFPNSHLCSRAGKECISNWPKSFFIAIAWRRRDAMAILCISDTFVTSTMDLTADPRKSPSITQI